MKKLAERGLLVRKLSGQQKLYGAMQIRHQMQLLKESTLAGGTGVTVNSQGSHHHTL